MKKPRLAALVAMAAVAALATAGCATPPTGTAQPVTANPMVERYWKLVELNGQPVPALEREPHLILQAEGGRVNGFGGCNGFSGAYAIDEAASRIRFENVAATMRACASGMDVEQAFHRVLRSTDNYSLGGDRMTLNRARMAPLARFEVVHRR